MLKDFIKKYITSQAGYVEYGYGQVEPNHLSAQRTGQIYAQLPADSSINVLEQGQFVKYDYATGLVNFTGPGEWMLVFNEIKLYRDHQVDCEFAMVKDNYQARIYSPYDGVNGVEADKQSRYYNGVANGGSNFYGKTEPEDVTAGNDPYEINYNEDPFHILGRYKEKEMPAGTTMVPRVLKTNVGDIMTTNTIKDTTVEVGNILVPQASNGILAVSAAPAATDMQWQVVKVYTMPDNQKGAKIMRIA